MANWALGPGCPEHDLLLFLPGKLGGLEIVVHYSVKSSLTYSSAWWQHWKPLEVLDKYVLDLNKLEAIGVPEKPCNHTSVLHNIAILLHTQRLIGLTH